MINRIKQTTIVALLSAFFLTGSAQTKIWVSTKGSDSNSGTMEQPLASLLKAQRMVRELRRTSAPSIDKGSEIIIKGGTYYLVEPLLFRPEDSGSETSPSIIKAAKGEKPIFSGGIQITDWKVAKGSLPGLPKEAEGKVWVASTPKVGGRPFEFRQLWVNNKKAIRAGTLNDGELNRIISVDKAGESFLIPTPKAKFEDISALEFVIHQWWAIAVLRVKSITPEGKNVRITFHQPESRIEFEHPWPAPFIDEKKELNGNSAFYLVNAIELLNEPGEWYQDLETGKVYYWPRKNEDLTKNKIVVPYLETIMKIEGTADLPVSHIQFEGINFNHTSWLRPSNEGHVPLQAGWSIVDAYKLKIPGTIDKAGLENQAWLERQSSGVTVSGANHITFEQCSFKHMAATGLDFIKSTNNNLVQGCVFKDIGGTGLQIGFFGGSNFEAHLPYNPADKRELCHHETIKNNFISNCTNEDWGCVGISVGYAHDVSIEHNDVGDLNYSGICVGWGWTKTITCMQNNRVHANNIHHFAKNMYDVGGIYTLSAQPNTEISENYIHHLEKAPYAHIPEHYQYIYYDEGSSYIRAKDNWTDKDKFFSNSPGPGNEWKNNGPEVDLEIKNKAGLESDYQFLLEN